VAADVDVRELRVPWWARLCVLLAALAQLALGLGLLLWPQSAWFAAVSGERLALQAVGMLSVAVAAGLFAAYARPLRNVSFVVAAAILKLVGLAWLVFVVASNGEWEATTPLLATETLGLLALTLALFGIARTPEVADLPEVRPVSTTTLFGLQQTLQALAAPATVQLTMFPDLVSNGARVMADFKQWRERALSKQDLLTSQQQDALRGLDETLQRMLLDDAVTLWNADAVRTAPEWGQLRASARRALVAFSWSVDMPMGVLKRRRETPSSIDLRPPS
jgi:hypothetical protein